MLVGFHARASDTIVDIPDCKLLHPGLMATLPALEEITATGATRKATLALTVTHSDAGADVAVTGGHPGDGPLFAKLADLATRHDLARLAWDGEVVVERRAPAQRFGVAQVVPPPGAFLQATEDGEAALRAEVTAALGGAGRIVDLFAGLGTFALPLAATAEIHAVEGESAMLEALSRGWRRAQGLKRVTTERRDLFRNPLRADELARFDDAVIEPPRAGAEAQIRQIAAAPLPHLAAVSCNPVSFARDARLLVEAGFRLGPIAVIDQFRWSSHVELATAFSR